MKVGWDLNVGTLRAKLRLFYEVFLFVVFCVCGFFGLATQLAGS